MTRDLEFKFIIRIIAQVNALGEFLSMSCSTLSPFNFTVTMLTPEIR